jgi:hypothetical protein
MPAFKSLFSGEKSTQSNLSYSLARSHTTQMCTGWYESAERNIETSLCIKDVFLEELALMVNLEERV